MERKVALITGSSTGIGRAIALKLAGEGMNIIVNYSRSEKDAYKTKKDIENLGVKCLVFKASIEDEEAVKNMIEKTIHELNRLDILVNNAGVTNFVDHEDLDGLKDEYWDRVMNVNVKGTFYCCKLAYPYLKKQSGTIVNITSVAGQTGLGSSIAYAASKAAANSLTKSLARVMAPKVRVNSIAPGLVSTRWIQDNEDDMRHLAEGTPLGRIATPEDIAELTYAVINHAGFLTGEIIRVDGGMFIN
ncbi:SDR family NAD(P)-dependent oxidoreductase [Oceanobacillus alkalisoli]|uniref:SDR family NAD(P)-dependent oxidoreductase n=1 Tax=Oceanobacillus alkalisoli TaxID=2925113 RepID=UPI001F11BF6A|nr:SDR family NAD(P)-dependent oxidoreductase [Oceanobacillus alkalisoli]MCF3942603.1 SDR family oxidoreductase [Oceanobacillus alkalisoli]